jgi:photosystem II stability/assembly factor-like uncharacterized protein
MRIPRRLFAGVLAVFAAAACIAFAAPPADPRPVAPAVVPAVRVPHASQATMLGVAHAGPRLVAVGDHGVVLLSDDGGRTQRQAAEVPVDATLTSVSFADGRRGWAVGHWGVILHTEDGGETWTLQRKETATDRPLFAVHFFDARSGVAVGLWSLVLVTGDGGAHWTTVDLPPPQGAKRADLNLYGLFADGHGRVFAAAEKGTVLRSDDRGLHWIYLPTGYNGSFWTGLVTPEGAILAAGLRGSVYRSTDDGASWRRVDSHSTSSVTALAQAGDRVVGVGLDGLELRSDDAGASFQVSVRPDRLPLAAVAVMPGGRIVRYSTQGVVHADGDAGGR